MMYESPIKLTIDNLLTKVVKRQEDDVLEYIQRLGINVNKEELIKALNCDREQYEKGYKDRDAEIVRCRQCEYWKINPNNLYGGYCKYCECAHIDHFCSYGKRKENKKQ